MRKDLLLHQRLRAVELSRLSLRALAAAEVEATARKKRRTSTNSSRSWRHTSRWNAQRIKMISAGAVRTSLVPRANNIVEMRLKSRAEYDKAVEVQKGQHAHGAPDPHLWIVMCTRAAQADVTVHPEAAKHVETIKKYGGEYGGMVALKKNVHVCRAGKTFKSTDKKIEIVASVAPTHVVVAISGVFEEVYGIEEKSGVAPRGGQQREVSALLEMLRKKIQVTRKSRECSYRSTGGVGGVTVGAAVR